MKRYFTSGAGWKRPTFLAAILCTLFLSPAACLRAADLIANGDFETGNFTGWTLNFTPPNNVAVIITTADRVYHGSNAVDFSWASAPPTAVISQTFSTISGAVYDVTFAFGTVAWADRLAGLRCDVLGTNGTTVLASRTLNRRGINPVGGQVYPAQWSLEALAFTADGSSATLRFTDVTTNSYAADALLDYVSVLRAVSLGITSSAPCQATLVWPTNAAGFALETTFSLPASAWNVVTDAPAIVGNLFNVTVPATNPHQFFRLRYP
jgi:hypothetical protein